MVVTIVLVVISLVLSAIFSGIEIAFISANRLAIELKKQEGSKSGALIASFFDKPSKVISTLLVGNNIALVFFALFLEEVLAETILSPYINDDFKFLFFSVCITTLIVLLFGEFLPKVLFRLNATKILTFFSYPLKVLNVLLSPFVFIMVNMSNWVMHKVLKVPEEATENAFTRVDLEDFINSVDTTSDQDINTEYFGNALKLTNLKVRECMVPRTEIEGVDITMPMDEVTETFKSSRVSKLIIYKETLDDIVGYIHHQQLFRYPKDLSSAMMEIPIVPETMLVNNVMNLMSRTRASICCVVDEYGGTSGIITHEDIIEEIVGEIEDEHDEEELVIVEVSKEEYILSGRLEVSFINERFPNLNLPEGDYQSLSGYILDKIERIPGQGDVVSIDRFRVECELMMANRIETVRLFVIEEDDSL